jgi:adenylate kinase family enzyme
MPVLEPGPRRVSVVGPTGAGKTTLAQRVAAAIDAPHLELDAVNLQANWQPLPADQFLARVSRFVEGAAWVVDGNYPSIQLGAVWPAADTVVWLDLGRSTVMRQTVWRSLKRAYFREVLWNGNREWLRHVLSWDAEKSPIRHSWTTFEPSRRRYRKAMADPAWAHLRFVRLTTRGEVDAYLAGLASSPWRDEPRPRRGTA